MANVELVKAIKNGNVVTSLGELAAGDTVTMKGDGSTVAGALALNNAANTFSTTLQSGAVSSNVTFTLPTADGTPNQVIRTDGSGNLSFVNDTDTGIANVQADTSPVLGGNLDVTTYSITTTTADGDVAIVPNGTGKMTVDGDVDLRVGGTTNKILFGNVYSTLGDLPSATDYHGMFAHVHGEGKAYFAHAGNWVPVANESDVPSLAGDQTYTGAQRGSITDNTTSTDFDLTTTNNFKCAPTGTSTLTFNSGTVPAAAVGQSGNIYFDNSATATINIATSVVKISSADSNRLSTVGVYWLSYYVVDTSNVVVTVSAALV